MGFDGAGAAAGAAAGVTAAGFSIPGGGFVESEEEDMGL